MVYKQILSISILNNVSDRQSTRLYITIIARFDLLKIHDLFINFRFRRSYNTPGRAGKFKTNLIPCVKANAHLGARPGVFYM